MFAVGVGLAMVAPNLRDGVRSDIWMELRIEPLLLWVEQRQLGWFGHLMMPCELLLLKNYGHYQLGRDSMLDP